MKGLFQTYLFFRGILYKIFVRAYVDTPQKHLYTSSPFSPELSLDMMQEPPGEAGQITMLKRENNKNAFFYLS